jgi:V/A-type H+-transporting ATPase subunit I
MSMLIARKTKIATIAVPKEYLNDVVGALVSLGLIQPMPMNQQNGGNKELMDLYRNITQARTKCEEISQVIGVSLRPEDSPAKFTSKDWINNAKEALREFEDIRKIIESKIEEIMQLQKVLEEYARLTKSIKPLSTLDIDLSQKPKFFGYLIAVVEEEKLSKLLDSVRHEDVFIEKVGIHGHSVGVIVLYRRAYEKEIEKVFSRLSVKPLVIPEELPQNPAKAYARLQELILSPRKSLEIEASQYLPSLLSVYSKLTVVEAALLLLNVSVITGSFAVIKGYINPDKADSIKELIRNLTRGSYLFSVEESKDAPVIPTIVRVPKPLRPFHNLVMQYGAPLPNEIVPTIFVAITFPLIFAMMFPDAGHALAVALFGAYYYYTRKSDYGLLFIYLGIAAFITGFLAGEFFGPLLHFGELVWHGHPPMESPVKATSPSEALFKLIGLSLRVGAFILIAGVALSFINSLIIGDYKKAFLSKLPKLILFGVPLTGFLFLGTHEALGAIYDAALGGASTLYGKLIRYSFFFSILGLLLLEPLYESAKHGKQVKIGMLLMSSFMEVFESILLLIGNTVSFLRILGLALAHSGIMYGFALMAERAFEGGIIGIMLGVIAYVFGNILGIVIEGIVAYAQCTRLHFYEWFTKFYSGKGKIFAPIKIRTKVLFQTQY